MPLTVAGVHYRTCGLETRERLAVSRSALAQRLATALSAAKCDEVVLLSTCNRVEAYVAGNAADAREALLNGLEVETDELFELEGTKAVGHLFRVASSLDSMVPGEAQILGQVRRAYDAARDAGTAARTMHGLFQRAIKVGKEVRAEAGLTAVRNGVAETAATHAEDVLGKLGGKKLLCVGTGKMNRLILRHFHSRPPSGRPASVAVIGRNQEKATRFAADFGGDGGSLDMLPIRLAEADLVVCGTGSPHPIVSEPVVRAAMRAREGQPLFVIDLALPRDVDPAVSKLDDVHLYDLDDLQAAAEIAAGGRRDELSIAERMVEKHVERFVAWQNGQKLGPLIDRLYDQANDAAQDEVQRFNRKLPGGLSADDQAKIADASEELARRLVNKLLHGPISSLRSMPDPERHATYRHAVEKLFQLDDE
ncbi:MAG: glutamyl-tRNA reductase [Planctomycetota bacterium]